MTGTMQEAMAGTMKDRESRVRQFGHMRPPQAQWGKLAREFLDVGQSSDLYLVDSLPAKKISKKTKLSHWRHTRRGGTMYHHIEPRLCTGVGEYSYVMP